MRFLAGKDLLNLLRQGRVFCGFMDMASYLMNEQQYLQEDECERSKLSREGECSFMVTSD